MKSYETSRLVLRTLEPGDTKALQDFLLRNRSFLEPWEPLRDDSFYSEEFIHRSILDSRELGRQGRSLMLYLFNKGQPRIIGNVGLTGIIYGPFLSCFMGYKMDSEEINQGKASEAISRVVGIAFQEYGLHRVEANVIPRNAPSRRVLEKLDFNQEGLSPKYLKINGVWEDHIHYVKLNDEME